MVLSACQASLLSPLAQQALLPPENLNLLPSNIFSSLIFGIHYLLYFEFYIFVSLSDKRESLLQHGKLDVVKALNDLPKTKHLASSFVVDVSRATVSSTVVEYVNEIC